MRGEARVVLRLARASVRGSIGRPRYLVMRLVGSAVFVLVEAAAVVILLGRFDSLAGWSADEVVVLIGLAQAGLGLAMFLGDPLEPPVFSALVREGTFDDALTRPLSPMLWVMTSDVQVRELARFGAGLTVFAWGAARAGVAWTPANVGVTVLAVACTTALVFSVLVFGAAATFFTVEGPELVNAFTYGGATLAGYPLSIYGPALRVVFLWVVPFGLAVFVPALTLLERKGPPGVPAGLLVVTPFATAAFAGVAALSWRRGITHYTGAGS